MPWDAALRITQLTGGKVHFVLASSGHIAGIINPPGGKGTYWTNFAYPVCCQYDESVIICRSGLPRLSNNASRFSAGFSR